MKPDFKVKLLALKAEAHLRRQVEIGAHRPRLQSNGLPLVFIEGDVMFSYPAPVWSAGVARGDLLQVGWVYATRSATMLRIDDMYIFKDLDAAMYLPALVQYLNIEAGLFGLDVMVVERGSGSNIA